MLRYGIPAYRLPPDLLDQELEQIKVLDIPIHRREGREPGAVPEGL